MINIPETDNLPDGVAETVETEELPIIDETSEFLRKLGCANADRLCLGHGSFLIYSEKDNKTYSMTVDSPGPSGEKRIDLFELIRKIEDIAGMPLKELVKVIQDRPDLIQKLRALKMD